VQQQVLTTLESQLESVKAIASAANAELSALKDLPAVLLRQAFTGEL